MKSASRRWRRQWSVVAMLCTAVGTPTTAAANGRFPDADQLMLDPSDPNRLVLRATFGMLQSVDAGDTWTWLCEQVIGYGGMDDPPIAITADGTLLVGVNGGVALSADRGCSWALTGGPAAGYRIVDVTVDRSDPAVALAITAEDPDGNPAPIVVASTDNGASWTKLSGDLPTDFIPQTIDTAPSMPARIYVSGNAPDTSEPPLLYRSDDNGATWFPLAIDTEARRAYISAIDPLDPDKLFLRLQGDDEDTLVLTEDGGQTWTPLLTLTSPMLGFALSPDGARIAVGTKAGGLHVAQTTDYAFELVAPTTVRCLTWAVAGLYVCASEATDGMTLGLSSADGQTLNPLYHLLDLSPQDCPAGTATAETCPLHWPAVEQQLGSGSGAGGAGPEGGAHGAPPTPKEDAGCSCSTGTRSQVWGHWLALSIGASALARRKASRISRRIADSRD